MSQESNNFFKEKVNFAMRVMLKLMEEARQRDSVLAEQLISTQINKKGIMTVKKEVHNSLQEFAAQVR